MTYSPRRSREEQAPSRPAIPRPIRSEKLPAAADSAEWNFWTARLGLGSSFDRFGRLLCFNRDSYVGPCVLLHR